MLFKDAQVTIDPVEIPDYVDRVIKNQKYGSEDYQLFDLYLPAGDGLHPIILDLQGGGLVRGMKSSFKLGPSLKFVKEGYAVISMNYALISTKSFSFPKQVAEIRAVLAKAKKDAEKYQLEANSVDLIGESSGAQLAMLTASSVTAKVKLGRIAAPDDLTDLPEIKHVIANYGPYEFDQFARQFQEEGIQPKYAESGQAISFEGLALAGLAVDGNPIGVSQANPANYFTKKTPAVLAYAGSADQVVPHQQSLDLIARYQKMTGKKAICHIISGGHHGIFDYDTPTIYQEKMAFLKDKD
ncbi:alpha/beta hydrolase [Fructobacillus cardui]|uniref:Acetyl esterase/lipase (Aes) n=1 Tax=Fructobacillus cardui TaxID=2893170 RepID=A0ABN9YYD7_9LACO|nr:Acetyl esterase/lipase (Aes) [Fructobacillus cardui]CAK1250927.1 Acetyl esterase/lipase (Aes) [Fructobacillus cardui]